MIFGKKNTGSETEKVVGSYLGPGLRIEGNLESKGDVRIDGEVKGNVFVEQDLAIGEKAEIHGEVMAENITIGGEVKGNVTANDKVELLKNAQLMGDIKASRVVIAEGVVFEGNCVVGTRGSLKNNEPDLDLDFQSSSSAKSSLLDSEEKERETSSFS